MCNGPFRSTFLVGCDACHGRLDNMQFALLELLTPRVGSQVERAGMDSSIGRGCLLRVIVEQTQRFIKLGSSN